MTEELLPFCECGECGLRVTKKDNRYIFGHNRRGKHHPHTTPAQIAADDAQREVPKPPRSFEHCAAMSAAQLGVPHTSPAQIAADEAHRVPHTSSAQIASDDAQRGGNDLVTHHYIYDHSDLSLNTVKMTRSDHMKLHHLLKRLGYIVPHINTEEE